MATDIIARGLAAKALQGGGSGGDVSKEYVDRNLEKKVDKIQGASANPRIYGVDEEGKQTSYFATQTPNANTIPLRDASGKFQVEDGVAPKQAVNKSQLDAGLSGKLDREAEGSIPIPWIPVFTGGKVVSTGAAREDNCFLVSDVDMSTGVESGTFYKHKEIWFSDDYQHGTLYMLRFPEREGTLALTSDIPADKVPFKYSKFVSSNDGDSWKLNDNSKILGLNYQDENSHANISLEKDYIELSDINGTGTAKVSLASNVITLDSENMEGQHKIIRTTPDKITIGNSTDSSLIEIDSNSTKFNNRPQVRDNGNYINVALADDLNNYVAVQSESADNYYAQLSNENGIISARIFQNGSDDAQNLTIDKTGVKVLGKKVATEDQLNNKLDALYSHKLVSVIKIDNINYSLVTNFISSKADAYTVLSDLPVIRMENISAVLIATDSDGNAYKSQVVASYYTDNIFISGVYIKSDASIAALQNSQVTIVTAIETYTPVKI